MKKSLFSVAAIALLATSCNTGPDRPKMKKTFTDACANAAKKEMAQSGMTGMDNLIDEYCECSGEKVVNSLSDEEIAAWNKDANAVPESRVMEITKTCTDNFTQKLQAKFAQ